MKIFSSPASMFITLLLRYAYDELAVHRHKRRNITLEQNKSIDWNVHKIIKALLTRSEKKCWRHSVSCLFGVRWKFWTHNAYHKKKKKRKKLCLRNSLRHVSTWTKHFGRRLVFCFLIAQLVQSNWNHNASDFDPEALCLSAVMS